MWCTTASQLIQKGFRDFSMRQKYVRTNAEVFVKRIVRCRSRRRPPLNQPAQVLSCWRVCSAQRLTQVNVQENSSTAEGRIEVTAYRNTHADVTTARFGRHAVFLTLGRWRAVGAVVNHEATGPHGHALQNDRGGDAALSLGWSNRYSNTHRIDHRSIRALQSQQSNRSTLMLSVSLQAVGARTHTQFRAGPGRAGTPWHG